MKLKKAVIPIAGKGTRFLPATKETPKEMLPILNVPMVHYVVQEAIDAGIEQIIFVTSSGKSSLENFYDRNLELENFLMEKGKTEELELVKKLGSSVEVLSVRQKEQLGLGHAILCAEPFFAPGEQFAVLLGDDIILGNNPVTKQLIEAAEANNADAVIGVMEVPREETSKYGIVDGEKTGDKTTKMNRMVEKPKPEDAPTCLATPGRYILNSEIFQVLKKIPRGAGGEYQLTDAINELAKTKNVIAYEFDGDRHDTGHVKGYLEATIEFALRNPELKEYTLQVLREKIKRYE